MPAVLTNNFDRYKALEQRKRIKEVLPSLLLRKTLKGVGRATWLAEGDLTLLVSSAKVRAAVRNGELLSVATL